MHHTLLYCSYSIPLLILSDQIPPQECQVQDQKGVASEVGGKGDEVSRSVPIEEHLGTDGVTCSPGYEVHGHGHGFLGLAGDLGCVQVSKG